MGAGVVGLCAADALLARGYRVTVVERDRQAGNGCSYGNGGLVVPSHFEPLAAPGMVLTGLKMLRSRESPFGFQGWPGLEMAGWMARFALAGTKAHVARSAPLLRDLNLASRALFENRYGGIASAYERRGELMVCRTAASLEREAHLAAVADGLGLRTRVLDREELSRFEDGIEFDAAGAVYFEDDAHLTPSLFMPALKDRVLAAGGELHEGARVESFALEDGRIKSARLSRSGGEGDEIAADEFVLAGGAWTGALAKKLGHRLPLLAGKGYGFTVTDPPSMPRYPAILVDGRVAVTPMRDGLRFVGTMELGLPSEPQANESRLRGMRRAISETYPSLRDHDLSGLPVWAGLRPCAPDGMPYIGRPGRFANLTVATGHGMMGMSLGPITGELVAQIVASEPLSHPLQLLSPDRYA